MKKAFYILLIFLFSCGPSEEEIQVLIDEAVSDATSTTTLTTTSTTTSTTTTSTTTTTTTTTVPKIDIVNPAAEFCGANQSLLLGENSSTVTFNNVLIIRVIDKEDQQFQNTLDCLFDYLEIPNYVISRLGSLDKQYQIQETDLDNLRIWFFSAVNGGYKLFITNTFSDDKSSSKSCDELIKSTKQFYSDNILMPYITVVYPGYEKVLNAYEQEYSLTSEDMEPQLDALSIYANDVEKYFQDSDTGSWGLNAYDYPYYTKILLDFYDYQFLLQDYVNKVYWFVTDLGVSTVLTAMLEYQEVEYATFEINNALNESLEPSLEIFEENCNK